MRTTSALPVLYTAVFSLRRFLMILTVLLLKERPVILIYVLLVVFSFNFVYLYYARSHTEPILNTLECFNELCLIGLLYIMIFFIKRHHLDPVLVWNAGLAALALLSLMFFFNFVYLIVSSIGKMLLEGRLVVIKKNNIRKHRLSQMKKKVNRKKTRANKKAKKQVKFNTFDSVKKFEM